MDGGTRRQGKHSSGVRGCFSVVRLLVAPFHYAIGRFPYTVWDGLRSAPFHYAIEGAVGVGWGGGGRQTGNCLSSRILCNNGHNVIEPLVLVF